jgi:membrane-bound metal-dependent hydrolase YbcI (DUF457 family)
MSLPVAHALLGASVVAALQPDASLRRDRKSLVLGAFLGIFPDFDYFLNLIPTLGGGWHHGFTHSFLFAFLAGLVTAIAWGKADRRGIIVYGSATLSHPLLDFLITESRGVELFWPFSNLRFKLRLPNPIDYSWRGTSVWETMIDLLRISLIELMIFAPLFLLILWIRRLNSRRLNLTRRIH